MTYVLSLEASTICKSLEIGPKRGGCQNVKILKTANPIMLGGKKVAVKPRAMERVRASEGEAWSVAWAVIRSAAKRDA